MSEGLLKGITPRPRELGRLRTGESVPVVKNGQVQTHDDGSPKMRPNKRETWRITSGSRHLLQEAADLYGGQVVVWEDAPTPGQWELATDKVSIEVMIPYDSALSQAFELWSGGGCQRRCDGERMDDDQPCVCPADIEARMKAAGQRTPTACKPTTRLNVLLPDIHELGYWRLEVHGYNAAVEIPGTLAMAQGIRVAYKDPNPWFIAWLKIDPRMKKKDGETLRYPVPVIEIPASGRSLMVGPGEKPALSGGGAPQIGPGRDSGPEAAPPPSDDPFDQFVSETWLAAFEERAAELPQAKVESIIKEGTGGRTSIAGQITKTESAAVKHALTTWLENPAEAESATA